MKDLDPLDVAILRLGLNQVAKLCTASREVAPGLAGLHVMGDALGEVTNRIVHLKEALEEPLNQLVTPPKKTTPAPEAVR